MFVKIYNRLEKMIEGTSLSVIAYYDEETLQYVTYPCDDNEISLFLADDFLGFSDLFVQISSKYPINAPKSLKI